MSEHPNVTLVRRGFAAFGEGDMATLSEIITPDAEQHAPGDSLISGDYKGRDAIFEFYGKLAELSEGTFRVDLEHVFVRGDQAIAEYHQTGTRNGRSLDVRHALVFQILDNKVVDLDDFTEDEDGDNEFWS